MGWGSQTEGDVHMKVGLALIGIFIVAPLLVVAGLAFVLLR